MEKIPSEFRGELTALIMQRMDDDTLRMMRTVSVGYRDAATKMLERRAAAAGRKMRLAQTTRGAMSSLGKLKASKLLENMDPNAAFRRACAHNVHAAREIYRTHRKGSLKRIRSIAEAYRRAMKEANLPAVRWMVNTFPRSWLHLNHDEPSNLELPALKGHTEMVLYLIDAFKIKPNARHIWEYRAAISAACMKGHLGLAQTLAGMVDKQTLADQIGKLRFKGWIWKSSPRTAQWLFSEFSMSQLEISVDELFKRVCECGNLELAQWLVSSGTVNIADVAKFDHRSLVAGKLSWKNVALIEWLEKLGKLETPPNDVGSDILALGIVCKTGDIKLVKWWVEDRTDMSREALRDGLKCAVEKGKLGVVKWLQSKIEMRMAPEEMAGSFIRSCKQGDEDVATWLVNDLGLDPSTLSRYSRIMMITHVISTHGVSTAKWVTTLAGKDPEYWKSEPLGWFLTACERGKLKMMQWLADTYPVIDKRRVQQQGNLLQGSTYLSGDFPLNVLTLYTACKNGHTSMIKWLVNRFDLTTPHAESERKSIDYSVCQSFLIACSRGYNGIAKWIAKRFRHVFNDTVSCKPMVLRDLCVMGNISMAKLVVRLSGPKGMDKRSICAELLGVIPAALTYLVEKRIILDIDSQDSPKPLSDTLIINNTIRQLVYEFKPSREDLQPIIQATSDLNLEVANWLRQRAAAAP